MRKRKGKVSTATGRGCRQMVVPPPSFSRRVPSIADIRGKLFAVNPKDRRARTQAIADALRADHPHRRFAFLRRERTSPIMR